MSVLVRIGSQKAILRQGEWISANPQLEDLLNTTMISWIHRTGGPGTGDGDKEGAVAREMIRQLGGKILRRIPSSPRETTRIYISHRQLSFDFS